MIRGATKRIAIVMVAIMATVCLSTIGYTVQGGALEPPVVTFRGPVGQDIAPDAPATLAFSRPMDHASVEKAFRVEPPMQGTFKWEGNTMTFQPKDGWERGVGYKISIESQAQSWLRQNLKSPVAFDFVAAGPLLVKSVQPGPKATEVAIADSVLVQFNRPVVALGSLASQSNLDPLNISPAVEGKGKWLNTSTYIFRPSKSLAPATRYQVAVKKGIKDRTGSELTDEYPWSFTTIAPGVADTSPGPDTQFASIGGGVKVSFNQPMDQASVREHFELRESDGAKMTGTYTWADSATMVFTPTNRLKPATKFAAKVSAGARGSTGQVATAADYAWSFTTAPKPQVVGYSPRDGEKSQIQQYWITFSSPMDSESLRKAVTFEPKVNSLFHNMGDNDTRLFLYGGLQPSTRYKVTVAAGTLSRDGQTLDSEFSYSFTTAALPPSVHLSSKGNAGAYSAYLNPEIYANYINVSRLDWSLYPIDEATFINLTANYDAYNKYRPTQQALRRWSSTKLAAGLNASGLLSENLAENGQRLAPGYYYVQVASPEGVGDRQLMTVSKVSLTLKRSEKELLVWAVDQASGNSVADLSLRVLNTSGAELASGKTGPDGLYATALPAPVVDPQGKIPTNPVLFVSARQAGDMAVASTNWSTGIGGWEFGFPVQYAIEKYKAEVYTDRPLYRTNQKVFYKGIVRADDDGKYSLPPAGLQVALSLRDANGREVQSAKVTLNDMGAFNGEFQIGADAALGFYRIEAKLGPSPTDQAVGASFTVAEYRKPEYQVTVTTDKKEYLPGERIAASMQASYFFGGPVAGGKVTWRVTSQDYRFKGPDGEWYNFSDADLLENRKPSEGLRAQGSGVTDAEGKFVFEIPVDLTQDPVSQIFSVEATVQDVNNQEVSALTEVVAHKSSLYLGARPARYVGKTGEPQSIEIISLDRSGKPAPSAVVSATVSLRKWSTVREKMADGGYRWISKHEDTEVSRQSVTTDKEGKGKATFTPKDGGSYWVVVRGRDAAGNDARSATEMYVSGSVYAGWRVENNDRLKLVADKKEYNTGDTAKILIPSPFPKATALLSIERGKVIEKRVISLDTNSPVIELPVKAAYLPNVYVSVVLVYVPDAQSPPSFKVGYVELPVSPADEKLIVTVTPDKERYEPQDTAVYTVKATGSDGKPVSAELSFALVDYAVLTLVDDNIRPAMDVFYGRRPLGVANASTLAISMDRLNADVGAAGKGVGDGNAGPNQDARTYFPDTAFWDPAVHTDANGIAKVSVMLPDNLTTWRARVRGYTAATQVGGTENDVVSSKTLLVRPVTPRFFTTGDEADLQAIVHNYGKTPVEVDVSLDGKGIEPRVDKSYKVHKINIPAGGNQKVTWPVKVGAPGQSTVTFSAKPTGGSLRSDVVTLKLPVLTQATAEVMATGGEVQDQVTETVNVDPGMERSLGNLTVEVAPSLAAGLRYSSQYLEEYPYECTEQTVSRFLPRVVMSRAFGKLGLPDKDGFGSELPGIVNRSMQRLYSGQRYDGGWGWWADDQSDPWMTAYVLLGMAEAQRGGFTVDTRAVSRAQEYLKRFLAVPPDAQNENLNLRAFVLFTMARSGQGDTGLTNSLFERRQKLGVYGQAYLAMTMVDLGANPKSDTKLQGLIADLTNQAKISATAAHWEEASIDYWSLNTNTRTTAIVLAALVRIAPDNALVPQTVRWLMTARKEGHWESTQDTAWSLLALTDYLAASGELEADYSYGVTLNGKQIGNQRVTKENVDKSQTLTAEVKDLIVGENQVLLGRLKPDGGQSGKGKMYYTMQFKYILPSDKIEAESQGLHVLREYLPADGRGDEISTAKSGDLIKVKLTIVAPEDMHYLIVEDPIPAGTEAVDTRLKTTSMAAQEQTGGQIKEQPGIKLPAWVPPDKQRRAWYFNKIEVRDSKVAVFATYLPRGTYEYTYLLRATTPGQYQAQPTLAYEMYFPEVWGRSGGASFKIAD